MQVVYRYDTETLKDQNRKLLLKKKTEEKARKAIWIAGINYQRYQDFHDDAGVECYR